MNGIIELMLDRSRPGEAMAKRRDHPPRDPMLARRTVEAVLALVVGLPEGGFPDPSRRGRRQDLLRQIAMYLAHVGAGVDMRAVGEAFRRDRTTVGHACRLIEDRREDARFDRLLDCLERATAAMAEATALGTLEARRLP